MKIYANTAQDARTIPCGRDNATGPSPGAGYSGKHNHKTSPVQLDPIGHDDEDTDDEDTGGEEASDGYRHQARDRSDFDHAEIEEQLCPWHEHRIGS